MSTQILTHKHSVIHSSSKPEMIQHPNDKQWIRGGIHAQGNATQPFKNEDLTPPTQCVWTLKTRSLKQTDTKAKRGLLLFIRNLQPRQICRNRKQSCGYRGCGRPKEWGPRLALTELQARGAGKRPEITGGATWCHSANKQPWLNSTLQQGALGNGN